MDLASETDPEGPTGAGAEGRNPPPAAPTPPPLVIYLLCRVLIIAARCIFPGIQSSVGLKVRECGGRSSTGAFKEQRRTRRAGNLISGWERVLNSAAAAKEYL